ncbi:MAG TPA: hypothetical protein VJ327_07340 [Patescibacteria group bacterium]|uniref:Uncharacterized protein n=1 Tax=Candidatus Amesbacteria bacterium RIFCSPLOWO2_01_FULL_48_25 TaxID=1797259 RepID=A0A1F4ZDV0_9BACT|nr:MAG: hypothetical protein A2989_01720 [Candidatus Amesbacteria bacterium RIFCSPLOWO2_01_FULL_48_25]HJZ05637.1 hypothetical protein [Patescibacteria group bacterium]
MCYNCGCGVPTDDMGKHPLHQGGGALVEADFTYMAKVWDMSVEETKKEVYETLKKQLSKDK